MAMLLRHGIQFDVQPHSEIVCNSPVAFYRSAFLFFSPLFSMLALLLSLSMCARTPAPRSQFALLTNLS